MTSLSLLTFEAAVPHCVPAGSCSYVGYPSVHHLLPDKYISTVAMTCKVDTASLERANSQIDDYNNVTAGMPVCVPQQCCRSLECTGGNDLAPAPTGSAVADGALMDECPLDRCFIHACMFAFQTLCICETACSGVCSLVHPLAHSFTHSPTHPLSNC